MTDITNPTDKLLEIGQSKFKNDPEGFREYLEGLAQKLPQVADEVAGQVHGARDSANQEMLLQQYEAEVEQIKEQMGLKMVPDYKHSKLISKYSALGLRNFGRAGKHHQPEHLDPSKSMLPPTR